MGGITAKEERGVDRVLTTVPRFADLRHTLFAGLISLTVATTDGTRYHSDYPSYDNPVTQPTVWGKSFR